MYWALMVLQILLIHRRCSLEFQLLRVVAVAFAFVWDCLLGRFLLVLVYFFYLLAHSLTLVCIHSHHIHLHSSTFFSHTMVSILIVAVLGVYKVKNNEY